MSLTIAIDGPSGSGKSTLSRKLAQAYRLAYLDTGAMYRAVTLWCMRQGIDTTDQKAVVEAAHRMPLTMVTDPQEPRCILDGDDITEEIRGPEVSGVVSNVAVNLEIRAFLNRAQRDIIAEENTAGFSKGRGIVAEGRDITTVVAPDADVRILVVADPSARMARRAAERFETVDAEALASVEHEVVGRDAKDSTVISFHEAADGVYTLDNSLLDIDETVDLAIRMVTEISGVAPESA